MHLLGMDSELLLEDVKKAEVLIISDEEDDLYVKKWIIPALKKADLKYILPELYIQPGKVRLSMIPAAIENSKKVLIILSEYTKKRFKCTMEIFLALEKSISTNKMCVTIALLGGLKKRDVPKIPMLEHSMIASLTENDLPYTIKTVIENLKGKSCRVNNS